MAVRENRRRATECNTTCSRSRQPKSRKMSRLRTVARHRRRLRVLVLLLPVILVVITDISLRGGRLADFPLKYVGSYAGAIVESTCLWVLLLVSASARRGVVRWLTGVAFVVLAALCMGSQLYFYERYSTYLNLDATLFATSMADSLAGQLGADSLGFIRSVLLVGAGAIALVWLGRRLVRTRRRVARWTGGIAPFALVGVLLIPCSYRSIQGSTPDVIYFHAMGGLMKQLTGIAETKHVRPRLRNPPKLPPISARPAVSRNVLFVVTESIRADVACSRHAESCPVTPFSNAAVPNRIGFEQMRSNTSTTAIQLAVLWSGLEPTSGRDALHDSPLLFEYAHAAGYDVAYWTSHHMMFANSRLFVQGLPLSFHCHATTLDPLADMDLGARDALLSERIKKEIGKLREPFFAVAHFGNTHMPYLVDDNDAPFQPSTASRAEKDTAAHFNYYKNAVYLQDRAVGDLIDFVRSSPFSNDTVILYTSDHGEHFREHGQLGHTGSIFDVEVRVPTWIDVPEGKLTGDELAAVRSYTERPVFHTDMTPTVLDLLGVWDNEELAPYRSAMVGSSLLRHSYNETTLSMTNCTGIWGCAFENWGVMRGTRKLLAREWDANWLCYDVATDPTEMSPLPLEQCQDLVEHADRVYPGLPGKH